MRRYLSLWFRHLPADDYALKNPDLRNQPFVMAASERGRMVIQAVNAQAEAEDIRVGMVVADVRAIYPSLKVVEKKEGVEKKLLLNLAEWSLHYTPDVGIDLPDGLLLDITGCPHLWGGERTYLKELVWRLRKMGYDIRAAIADTIGAAWAVARYGTITPIIKSGQQKEALLHLPPAALRLERKNIEKLHQLGLYTIEHFIDWPSQTLRRRFGASFIMRINQALGSMEEEIQPIRLLPPYEERWTGMEPIRTAGGIKIALCKLLKKLCQRLQGEGKGLRVAILTCYRVDHEIQQISIATGRASRSEAHLLGLFELKIPAIRPALGIEAFLLEAPVVEKLSAAQEMLWQDTEADKEVMTEFLDKVSGKIGREKVHRYLPQARHLPQFAYREADILQEKSAIPWPSGKLRPICLLSPPQRITVAVPLPDYPPLWFNYRGKLHRIVKADGPERIEQEWWVKDGLYRDYYCVEDEEGARYWLFRSGHFKDKKSGWYLCGFFA